VWLLSLRIFREGNKLYSSTSPSTRLALALVTQGRSRPHQICCSTSRITAVGIRRWRTARARAGCQHSNGGKNSKCHMKHLNGKDTYTRHAIQPLSAALSHPIKASGLERDHDQQHALLLDLPLEKVGEELLLDIGLPLGALGLEMISW